MSPIPASRITTLAAVDALVSTDAGAPAYLVPVKPDDIRARIGSWPGRLGLFDHSMRIDAIDGDATLAVGPHAGPEVQQLIEAMSRFRAGPDAMPWLHEGGMTDSFPSAASHVAEHPFKPRSAACAF